MSPGKAWIRKQILKDTLGVFRNGCDEINFKILNSLPITIKDLEKKLGLTNKPVNARVNALVEYGLAEREKGKGKVKPTKMTRIFLKIIDKLTEEVEELLPKYVS